MKEEIRNLIKELTLHDIVSDSEPMYLDSIDFLDVVIKLEDTHNIHIDISQINKSASLNEFSEFVEKLIG